jgi:hypothetical protein
MQGIQPQRLTDEELLRYVYIQGFDKLPAEWVQELCKRLAARIDANR